MNIRPLIRGILTLVAAGIIYFIYLLINQWQYHRIGSFDTRLNRLTGIAEIRQNNQWTRFQDDPYAEPVPTEKLKRIRIENLAWGPEGLLVGHAVNRLADPIKGRLAIRIVLRNKKDQRFVRDRSLRVTVDFPPGKPTSFIIRTNLTTPDPEKLTTELELQPTSFSGM